jgi:hypothetical protein
MINLNVLHPMEFIFLSLYSKKFKSVRLIQSICKNYIQLNLFLTVFEFWGFLVCQLTIFYYQCYFIFWSLLVLKLLDWLFSSIKNPIYPQLFSSLTAA